MQKNLELQGGKYCMSKGARGSIQRLAFVRGRVSVGVFLCHSRELLLLGIQCKSLAAEKVGLS